jgi:hypothetical protein
MTCCIFNKKKKSKFIDKNIIDLYKDAININDYYNIDYILNKSLQIYYDDSLNDLYIHKKKSYVIASFLRNIDVILYNSDDHKIDEIDNDKKNNDKKNNEIRIYLNKMRIPIFIIEIIELYRHIDLINIDKLKENIRYNDLLLLLKYDNTININQNILAMTREDKFDLIQKLINDIVII